MIYHQELLPNLIFISLSLLIAFFTYYKKQLTLAASITAFFTASILYLSGGELFFSCLMFFFFSSTLITKFGKMKRSDVEKIHEKKGRRDIYQVLANSGLAVVFAILFAFTQDLRFQIAVLVCIASATADTWASEIGIFSTKPPISILRLKPVLRGLSGGVSGLGMLASLGGALMIGLIYWIFQNPNVSMDLFLIIVSLGVLGGIVDSILGDLIQAKYLNIKTNTLTEKRLTHEQPNRLIKGFAWVNNDWINFMSIFVVNVVLFIGWILF